MGGSLVRVANHAAHPFHGWIRVTTDRPPAYRAGIVTTDAGDEIRFVVGLPTGSDTRAVDLLVALEPGQRLEVDLSGAEAAPFDLGPPPANLGDLTVNGVPMRLVEAKPDGAAWTAHCRARIGRMLCVDVWLWHYPGEAWAHGECMVTCSNPAVPDLGESLDENGICMSWGAALLLVLGGEPHRLVEPYTVFADGQARTVPFLALFAYQWSDDQPAALTQVAATGVASLYPQGNPILPPDFDAAAFMREKVPEAVRRIHTWEPGVTGPPANSGQTGEQSDAVFVGGECFAANGTGAEFVTYLSALELAGRPCHHLEADGGPLRHNEHPNLVFWNGRPFGHLGISPDQLGKDRSLTREETPGLYFGPDSQHFFAFTLLAACRLRYSPACQRLLENWARVYLLQFTLTSGLYTSGPDSARSEGWMHLMAVGMHRQLADRELAKEVEARAKARIWRVSLPNHSLYGPLWDVRNDDDRLGPGPWVILWQHAVEAYGLDVAADYFGLPDARPIALRQARAVLDAGWIHHEGRWLSCAQRSILHAPNYDSSFNFYGMPLAAAVVLRHDHADERALSIMQQLRREARKPSEVRWLAPEVAR